MYTSRYTPNEEVTVPENYGGSQFRTAKPKEEALEEELPPVLEEKTEDTPFPQADIARSEEPKSEEIKEFLTADNLLVLLAFLLSENSRDELETFLLFLLLF